GNSMQAKEINSYLMVVQSNLMIKKREIEEDGKLMTAEVLRMAYLGLDDVQKTLLALFREHNAKCKQLVNIDFAPGTYVKYQSCLNHLEKFVTKKLGKSDVRFQEVTPMFLKDFEVYLKIEGGCCNNSAVKYLSNLKKIVRIAMANGWLKGNPYAGVSFRMDEVDVAYLDEKELKRLMNKKFDIERIEQVKDVYLFCCFTGLAFIDVKSLCKKDLIEIDGQWWIKKKRSKTKNWFQVPLLEPAVRILEKYEDNIICLTSGKLLPVLSNQKMNAYLKEIADLAGINKHLSTHTARHTFATTVTLSNQVSMKVVSKMLGHSSLKMTEKYARVVDELIEKDMRKVMMKFRPKNLVDN
ncbi:MAG: site-specific integrase, partial [Ignavibacteria bacterium]|nr:site-specific integrase [Ignavibacteria bacterium]